MMNDSVIAGALFDFMGWLTSRPKRIMLSSVDDASPAVDAIRDFAKMRSLSLDDAKVQDWQEALAQPEQNLSCKSTQARLAVAWGYVQAQPEKEPVAWITKTGNVWKTKADETDTPLYTTPPQRKPLRDHEIAKILDRERMKWHKSPPTYEFDLAFARAIEAAHGIKE